MVGGGLGGYEGVVVAQSLFKALRDCFVVEGVVVSAGGLDDLCRIIRVGGTIQDS